MKIDIAAAELTTEQRQIARGIVNRSGNLYKSRPTNKSGDTQYVWRMVAFFVSPVRAHQCMPVMAEFYIGERDWDKRRARTKELDQIVDAVVNAVPVEEWNGVRRWAGLGLA